MTRQSLYSAGYRMRHLPLIVVMFALGLLFATATATAQQPVAEASTGSAAEGSAVAQGYSVEELSEQGFRPAESARPGDTVAGGPLLVAAYALFWGMVVTYVGMLIRRQSATGKALQQLQSRLNDVEDRLQSAEARNRNS
jgi:hypothetical protein